MTAPVTALPELTAGGFEAAQALAPAAYKALGWVPLAHLTALGYERAEVISTLGTGVRAPNPFSTKNPLRLYPLDWALAQLRAATGGPVCPWGPQYGAPMLPGQSPDWISREQVLARGWLGSDFGHGLCPEGTMIQVYPLDYVLEQELKVGVTRFEGLMTGRPGVAMSGSLLRQTLEHGARVALSGNYELPDYRSALVQVHPGMWNFRRAPVRKPGWRDSTPRLSTTKVARQLLAHSPVWAAAQATPRQLAALGSELRGRVHLATEVHVSALMFAYPLLVPAFRKEMARVRLRPAALPEGSRLVAQVAELAAQPSGMRYVHVKGERPEPLVHEWQLSHQPTSVKTMSWDQLLEFAGVDRVLRLGSRFGSLESVRQHFLRAELTAEGDLSVSFS